MIKKDELANPNSCINRAEDDEIVFVLLGRDPVASIAIRAWASQRVILKKNKITDPQIEEAIAVAEILEAKHDAEADYSNYWKDLT